MLGTKHRNDCLIWRVFLIDGHIACELCQCYYLSFYFLFVCTLKHAVSQFLNKGSNQHLLVMGMQSLQRTTREVPISLFILFSHFYLSISYLPLSLSLFFFLNTYLLGCTRSQLQHVGSLIAACQLLVAACGIQFPDQGTNPGPLHWESRVLATEPSQKSLSISYPRVFNLFL